MSDRQMLTFLVSQRLAAAARDISELFERAIADYEEELSVLRDNGRQQQQPQANFEHQLCRADDQQVLVVKEEAPSEPSPGLNQGDPKKEEVRSNLKGEQLQELVRADSIKFPFTEEKSQSSQLHGVMTDESKEAEPLPGCSAEGTKTEAVGEDFGESECAKNFDSHRHLQPIKEEQSSELSVTEDGDNEWQRPLSGSDPEIEDSDTGWKETSAPEAGLNILNSNEANVNDRSCNTGKKSFSCSKCGKLFGQKCKLQEHMRVHSGEKPFGCDVCGKLFTQQAPLRRHMRVHTGGKPFGCDVCGTFFTAKRNLKEHTSGHTGEKQCGCDVCGNRFAHKWQLKKHKRVLHK